MSGSCELCLKNINKRSAPGVKCGSSVSVFHIKCAGINDTVLKELKLGSSKWLCPDCRLSTNSSVIDGESDGNDDLVQNITKPNLSDLMMILKGMQCKLDALTNSFNYLCKTIDDLKGTIDQLTKGAVASDQKLETLEGKLTVQDEKINAMEAQLDRANQALNRNNIIVCGIPTNCEDIPSVIIKIVQLTGIQIMNDDVISIKQTVHNNKYTQKNSFFKHSFIVAFKTAEMRNEIINAFRNKKTIYYNELALDYASTLENKRIFLLHHFTKFQSQLYGAAKNIKTNFNFQYLWYKDNNIYLRKQAGSNVLRISSFNDINHITNTYPANSSCNPDTPLVDFASSSISGVPVQAASTSASLEA